MPPTCHETGDATVMFELKDSKGKRFIGVAVGPRFALADGRLLQYVDVEDTFRIDETGEVLMRPLPSVRARVS